MSTNFGAVMGTTKPSKISFLFLIFTYLLAALLFIQGFATHEAVLLHHQRVFDSSPSLPEFYFQDVSPVVLRKRNSRRMLIGSTAPTCTYNECRGCKFKCRAEQIPVDANDPINSAYHYRCVCHR